ncbi:MAG: S41 family peptidase [Flavobacteriaceae bacterium]|nr:peptidase S41 [Flavobacteriaceae bacterium]
MKKTYFLLILFVLPLFTSCFKDQDDEINPSSVSEINDFIYRGLNFFYLYKADTPELANDYFANDSDYNNFLNSYATPESFFDYLKSSQDRFSILVDNYIELENALSGITKNNGMEYGLVRYPEQNGNVFGYVRYVLPNTDAANKGLKRGDIFNSIDGQQLTESNYVTLLAPDSYAIGLATFDGQTINATGNSVELLKGEVTENPIHTTQTFEVNGHKIGYLMYNGFTSDFDSQLNSAFGQFKANGVTDLVLDLRYNGGGAVRTATYLASMITGQYTGQIFYTEQWNADRQDAYAENGVFVSNFEGGGESINSLHLNRVYVLTSSRTASASELVINGLAPHIEVIQIGTNTTGKFQASFLMYDSPNFGRSGANLGHTYAMLPLVFKTANAAGNTDYVNGLFPDIEQAEDYSNLGVLGDVNEPLLATAIANIVGIPAPVPARNVSLEVISESKAQLPNYQVMYFTTKK